MFLSSDDNGEGKDSDLVGDVSNEYCFVERSVSLLFRGDDIDDCDSIARPDELSLSYRLRYDKHLNCMMFNRSSNMPEPFRVMSMTRFIRSCFRSNRSLSNRSLSVASD